MLFSNIYSHAKLIQTTFGQHAVYCN